MDDQHGAKADDHWATRWPGERVERLKALWPIMSASQIGHAMGVSRSAIIGKVHRLKLPLKKPDRLLTPKRGGRPHKAPMPPPWLKPAPPYPPPVPQTVSSDKSAPEFLDRTFGELGAGECRYPHGDQAPYRYCAQPCDGTSSYCCHHRQLTHHASPPMRRDWVDWGAR